MIKIALKWLPLAMLLVGSAVVIGAKSSRRPTQSVNPPTLTNNTTVTVPADCPTPTLYVPYFCAFTVSPPVPLTSTCVLTQQNMSGLTSTLSSDGTACITQGTPTPTPAAPSGIKLTTL